ncbi:Transcription factor IIIA [Galdieria sulphuraria]|nr:Transcription factor IIIA [Galdieria sulphuraria]
MFRNDDSTALFTCDWCGKSYRTRSKRIAHIRTHTGERPYICSYPCCGRSYTRSDHLRRHEWSHQELKPFTCSRINCAQSFATKQRLQRHERSHSAKMAFTCTFPCCGRAFRKKRQLAEHCLSHSSIYSTCNYEDIENKYEGSVNSIDVGNNSSLLFQVPEEWTCLPYFCSVPDCNKGFRSYAELSAHCQEAHDKVVFSCNYCDKTFSKYSSWLRHLSTHEESVQVRQVFPCHFPSCSKKFTSSYNCMVHERAVHEKQYLFECSFCERRFTLESSLQRHVRKLHNDDKDREANKEQKNSVIESRWEPSVEREMTYSHVLKALCGKS